MLNVNVRIFHSPHEGYIALLTNFNGGAKRFTDDDPIALVGRVHEWMTDVEKQGKGDQL